MTSSTGGGTYPRRRGAVGWRRGAAAALAWGLSLGGCYRQIPVEMGALAPREEVRVWLSPTGVAAVAPVLGSQATALEGTVLAAGPSDLTLQVPVAVQQVGFQRSVLHQEIRLRPGEYSMLQRRELDRTRTAVVVTGVGAALAGAAWATISGWTGASSDREVTEEPAQARVPLIFAIPIR